MKNLSRKKNDTVFFKLKSTARIFILLLFFFGKINSLTAVSIVNDTIPQPANLLDLQGNINKINNSAGLQQSKIKLEKQTALSGSSKYFILGTHT